MSDLPPYLTHVPSRRVPWKGHAAFPRKVIQLQAKLIQERPDLAKYYRCSRVFKLDLQDFSYHLLSDQQVQQYMEDPTRV